MATCYNKGDFSNQARAAFIFISTHTMKNLTIAKILDFDILHFLYFGLYYYNQLLAYYSLQIYDI
nr:MAG TPA: hypothetical protein [Bacteriophage sp.]